MGIEEAILQEFKEKGLREGREEGLKEGLKEGCKEGRKQGLEQGLEQGFTRGINEKERTVISRAWEKGMPIVEIADLVDVSVEKVKAVIEELKEEDGE